MDGPVLPAGQAEAAGGSESLLEYLIGAGIRSGVGFIFIFLLTSSHPILILRNSLA